MNDDRDNPSPDGFSAVPPGDLPRAHFDTPWSEPISLADVLAPTWASLRVERGAPADGDRRRPAPEIDIIRHALTRRSVPLTGLAGEFAASRSGTRAPAPPERSNTSHAGILRATGVYRRGGRARSASGGCAAEAGVRSSAEPDGRSVMRLKARLQRLASRLWSRRDTTMRRGWRNSGSTMPGCAATAPSHRRNRVRPGGTRPSGPRACASASPPDCGYAANTSQATGYQE
jgi:hypothetical protein